MPIFNKGYSAKNLYQLADHDLRIISPNHTWDETNRVSMKCYKYYLAKFAQLKNGEAGYYLLTHEDCYRKSPETLISVVADDRFTEWRILGWALQDNGSLYPLIVGSGKDDALCIDLFTSNNFISYSNYSKNPLVVLHSNYQTMFNNIMHRRRDYPKWADFMSELINIHKGNNQNDFSSGCITLNQHEAATAIKIMKNSVYGRFDNDENTEFKILESHPKIEKKKVDLSVGMEANYLLL